MNQEEIGFVVAEFVRLHLAKQDEPRKVYFSFVVAQLAGLCVVALRLNLTIYL